MGLGTMSAADWDTATIGALRIQCVWRGFMDRRRMFYHREYVQCGSTQMERLRCALSALTYAIMTSYIAFTTYSHAYASSSLPPKGIVD